MPIYTNLPHNSGNRRRGPYDDQQQPASDEELREMSGITPGEEGQMDQDAEQGAYDDKFNDIRDQEEGGAWKSGEATSSNGGGDGKDKKKKSDSEEDLRNKEQGKEDDKQGFTSKAAEEAFKLADRRLGGAFFKFVASLKGNKKAKGAGAATGILAGIIAIIFGSIVSILPLKTLHFTENLEDIYFASVNQAGQEVIESMLHDYYLNHVLPGMLGKKGCTTTKIDTSCARVGDAKTGPGALYRIWHQNNLEGKLANHPEIELEVMRDGTRFYVRSKQIQKRIDVGTYNESNTKVIGDKMYAVMNRQEMRQVKKEVLEDITAHKRILYWASIGRWLDYKYKIRRCIMVCKYVDKFDDFKELKANAFKMYLVERLLLPRSDIMGLVFECALSGFSCTDPQPSDQYGEKKSQFESDVRTRLAAHQYKYGDKGIDELKKDVDTVQNKGFMFYALERLAGKTAATVAYKVIPIVGWVDFGARIYSGGAKMHSAMIKMNFVINTTGYVAHYAMMRTNADEIKTGHVNPGNMTTMAASYDRNPDADQGGGAAQDSPSYNAIMHYGNPDPNHVFNWDRNRVYAAESKYGCDTGPYQPGKLICPEVSNDAQSTPMKLGENISGFFNNPANAFPLFIATIWVNTGGALFDFVSAMTVGKLAGAVAAALNAMTAGQLAELTAWITNKVAKMIIVTPFSDKMAGSRNWEVDLCGANVSGNEAARWVQGGQALQPSQITAIRAQQFAERRERFKSKPLFARVFDKHDSMSLMSRVADATPNSEGSAGTLVASVSSGLMQTASASLASTILPETAFAAQRQTPDPCGITQYGWPKDSRILQAGTQYDKEWIDKKCDDPSQQQLWGDTAKVVNPHTQMLEHTKGNECMLMRSAVSAGGGKFEQELLQTFGEQSAGAAGPSGGDGKWHWPPAGKFNSGPCWNSRISLGYHAGLDMNADKFGTKAVAAHDGVVEKVYAGGGGAAGNYVIVKISGPETLYYAYEHLGGGTIEVKEGQSVIGGQTVIGTIGNTGRIFGAPNGHLHMVVAPTATLGSYSSSPQTNTLDPMKYLPNPAPHGYKCY